MSDCNTTTYSGYTKGTPQNYLLDSGAIFKDFEYGVDTYASAKAAGKLLGATEGGSSFNVVADMRDEEVDGVKGSYRGGTIFNNWTVEMTVNFKETNLEVLRAALTNTTIDTTTYAAVDKITAGNYICDDNYYDNITFVGKIQGSTKPIVIQITDALGMGGLTFQTAKNTTAKHAVTFKGHYNEDNLDNPPFEIFLPKMTGTISGYISTGAAAAGTLTLDTLPTAADTMTVGATTYTFVADADYEEAGQISLGSGLAECQANIVAAINGTDLYNTANDDVTAGDFAANDCILTATVPGADGNTIVTTETFTAVTNIFDGTTLGTTVSGSGSPQDGATASVVVGGTTYSATTDATGQFTGLSVPYGASRTVTATASALTGSTTATIVGGKNTDVGVIIVS